MFNFLIIGAGVSGSVLAEMIASQLNKKVLVIDKRNHIGGNAFDYYNESGKLIHKYEPHWFQAAEGDLKKCNSIPGNANHELYRKYKQDADELGNFLFCGRLADYKYYNIDPIVARALMLFDQKIISTK